MEERLYNAAREVHDELGGGHTESVYHRALERELSERQIPFHSEGTIPIMYKGAPVGTRRPDMFVVPEYGDTIVVELKSNSTTGEKQLLKYLDIVETDSNIGEIAGGVLISFNDDLQFDYREADKND